MYCCFNMVHNWSYVFLVGEVGLQILWTTLYASEHNDLSSDETFNESSEIFNCNMCISKRSHQWIQLSVVSKIGIWDACTMVDGDVDSVSFVILMTFICLDLLSKKNFVLEILLNRWLVKNNHVASLLSPMSCISLLKISVYFSVVRLGMSNLLKTINYVNVNVK